MSFVHSITFHREGDHFTPGSRRLLDIAFDGEEEKQSRFLWSLDHHDSASA